MEVQLLARNLEIPPRLEEYATKKMEKLGRYLPDIQKARMELSAENTRSSAHRQVVQLTVWTRGGMLRSEERDQDIYTAIDAAMDKMRRQITRHKTRRIERRYRIEAEEPFPEEAETEEIIRVKRFEVRPMTPEEAIEQMELLDHQFFVFLNSEEGLICVIYRRTRGGYGLIIPQVR